MLCRGSKGKEAGVSEADLADLGYICILTAGIPTWFELELTIEIERQIKVEGKSTVKN